MSGLRRDRTGEPIDEDDDATASHHGCEGGWLDPDNAVPCEYCRPELGRLLDRRAARAARRQARAHDVPMPRPEPP